MCKPLLSQLVPFLFLRPQRMMRGLTCKHALGDCSAVARSRARWAHRDGTISGSSRWSQWWWGLRWQRFLQGHCNSSVLKWQCDFGTANPYKIMGSYGLPAPHMLKIPASSCQDLCCAQRRPPPTPTTPDFEADIFGPNFGHIVMMFPVPRNSHPTKAPAQGAFQKFHSINLYDKNGIWGMLRRSLDHTY